MSVTIIAWLFIAAGTVGLLYHVSEINPGHRLDPELILACFVRLLAIVGGAFLLRGRNWARWLLAAWMVYHIILSAFHDLVEFGMHLLLFGVLGYFLFRPQASAYFRRPATPQRPLPATGDQPATRP